MHLAGHSVFFKDKDGKVYIEWRMLGTDPENIAFNVYRNNICVNSKPITKSHDPIYRLSVAWQNVAYNQPAQPGFYMGGRYGSTDPSFDNNTCSLKCEIAAHNDFYFLLLAK